MKDRFLKTQIVVAMIAMLFMAAFISNITGIPFLLIAGVFLVTGLIKRPDGVLRNDINPDVSKILTYLGKVKAGVFTKLVNSMDIMNDITMVPNVKNVLTLTQLTIRNGFKPYTGVFRPAANDIDYDPRQLVVEQMQRDLRIDPRKYRISYFADQRGAGEGSKNNKIPFEQYTIKSVLEHDAAELNDRTAFFGLGKAAFAAFNPAVPYAVGAKIKISKNDEIQYFIAKEITLAGESPITHPDKWEDANDLAVCKGLGTHFKEARANDEFQRVVSIAGLDAYPAFKKVFRALSPARKAKGANLYAPLNRVEELMDDFENKVGKYTENDGSGLMYLANTGRKCRIVPTTWQNGSNMLFAGGKENFLGGTDLLSDLNEVNIIPGVYHLDMGIAATLGFNFQDPDDMSISDED
ncbi:hypothetical protein BDE36_1784 [Arcticibacter tournemirensis]|uniref:Uncharacterized protein n=1 Tax=Arcticibacter tournemirensis TaxID=699437 RepID=A0A5M9H9Y3_9SPHI|nr:hypothetical protein [Arcticibacter tournemirensis]KAA8483752.1 hypothetical protein F1649_07640 [Arcticibacter tournemirensis]TQM50049.1 hypothetical protein BDE36_1784 [Arcticibacter tournemirensis]